MPRFIPWVGLWVLSSLLVPATATSQEGSITGSVSDSLTRMAVIGARVEARAPGGAVVERGETDARGNFRLRLDGKYPVAVLVNAVGYEPWQGFVGPVITVRLVPRPAMLAPVEVVARESQSIIDVPAAVSIIELTPQAAVVLSPAKYLEKDPGISMARKGLTQATFSARGPSAANSAALLVLQDYRLASVPSLRLNVPYLIPATSEDLERIEVTRGPSSVVYGADADRGVVNFISRSPFSSQGTTITTAAGSRSIHQVGFRHASQLGRNVAVKLSGEYFEGNDWPASDPKDSLPRDGHIERASGEARVDWQAGSRTMVIFSGGLAQAINNVDLTEVGPIQVKDWRYTFGQLRILRDRLFINVFLNQNDAGKSFQRYTGSPIVDDSRALSAQVQYGSVLGRHWDLTYGADVQQVQPRTEGTIHGRNEANDDITLAGVYLSSTTSLASSLSLVSSLRADHHSRLDDLALSPRLGLVYKPGRLHALRLTWNRATSTPVASDLFLDLTSGAVPGTPYTIRARGTAEKLAFRRDCNGLCMRSPFLDDASMFVSADATILWPWVVDYLQTQQVDLSPIPAPGPQDVGTDFRVLNIGTKAFDPVEASSLLDIPAARRSYASTIEGGYRGEIGGRVSLSIDVYHSRLTNVMTPITVQTPNVFFDSLMLADYLANFIPRQNADALAGQIGQIPLGIVTPEQGNSTEILAVGRQGARANFWGADLSLSVSLGRSLSMRGTLAWASKDRVSSPNGLSDIVFNSPRTQGGVGLAYQVPASGLAVEVGGRSVSSFPVASGEYSGRVSSYTVMDASVTYRFPWASAITLTLTVDNLLNAKHREFVGAPVLGRLLLARIKADF